MPRNRENGRLSRPGPDKCRRIQKMAVYQDLVLIKMGNPQFIKTLSVTTLCGGDLGTPNVRRRCFCVFYRISAFYQELVLIKAEVRDLPATLAPKGDFISQSMMHSILQHHLYPTPRKTACVFVLVGTVADVDECLCADWLRPIRCISRT